MKELVEYLAARKIICKTLREIVPKELGTRKKVGIFVGVDLKGYYCLVMHLSKKSRVLRKEAGELLDLHKRIEEYRDTKIKKCYIRIDAPLCSKAKTMFEENGWVVWNESES